jgi:NADH-quinone oxidoreductase subunit J
VTSFDVAFAAVGLIAAASGLLSVTTRHVVHSALWLVVSLGSVAGCYLVLGAEFVALVQLLVYVGAIVVLVLFALMLTRAPIGPNPDVSTSRLHRVLAAVLGVGVTALLGAALLPLAGPARPRGETSTTVLAGQLFGTWVWPFELLSLLLLVSLIAALAVSRMSGTPVVPGQRESGERERAGDPEPVRDREPVGDSA